MGIFRNLKHKTVKTGKRLFAYNQLHQGLRDQASILKEVIRYETHAIKPSPESFFIPVAQVKAAQKSFVRLLIIFLSLFAMGVLYMMANFIRGDFILGLLSLAFCILTLSFAFRYHFWLHQIKARKLGLSFKDYYRDALKKYFVKQKQKPVVVKKDKK